MSRYTETVRNPIKQFLNDLNRQLFPDAKSYAIKGYSSNKNSLDIYSFFTFTDCDTAFGYLRLLNAAAEITKHFANDPLFMYIQFCAPDEDSVWTKYCFSQHQDIPVIRMRVVFQEANIR